MSVATETLPAVTLRQLQYLVAVADLGGFRRAADACHVAQPSLSAQIAHAERQLGVQVFERSRRHVRVTPAGEAIVAQARRVLVSASDLGTVARHGADPLCGTLRLGVIPTIAPYLLPMAAPRLLQRFPALTVRWTEAQTAMLVAALAGGTLDAAILSSTEETAHLESLALGWDPFVVAAAPGHSILRGRGALAADALDRAQVLLLDDGHCLREQALAVCRKAGAREHGFRATSLVTLVQMVSAGEWVTLLPSLSLPVENRHAQLGIRRLASPELGREIALVCRRGSPYAAPLGAIAEVLTQALAEAGGGWPQPTARSTSPATSARRRR